MIVGHMWRYSPRMTHDHERGDTGRGETGFCEKGEGGPFAASGVLGPDGKLKLNTGGGQLSSYYMWGMTPLSEAVIQARGQGGQRQVPRHDLVLVSGNGGVLDHHSTLILAAAS